MIFSALFLYWTNENVTVILNVLNCNNCINWECSQGQYSPMYAGRSLGKFKAFNETCPQITLLSYTPSGHDNGKGVMVRLISHVVINWGPPYLLHIDIDKGLNLEYCQGQNRWEILLLTSGCSRLQRQLAYILMLFVIWYEAVL